VYFSKLYKDYYDHICEYIHYLYSTRTHYCILYYMYTVLIYKLYKGFTRKLCSKRVYTIHIYIYIYYRHLYICLCYTHTTLHVKRCSSIITLVTLVDLETIYYKYIYVCVCVCVNTYIFAKTFATLELGRFSSLIISSYTTPWLT